MSGKEKICPLMSVGRFAAAPRAGESCAWWDHLARTCCVNSGADYLRKAGDNLREALEALADRTAKDQDR